MSWERAEAIKKGPKCLITGPTGCYKTRSILKAGDQPKGEAPRLLMLDYEDGADPYRKEFNFACIKAQQVMRLDDPDLTITDQEIADLKDDRHVYKPMIEQGLAYGIDIMRVTILNRLAHKPIDFVCVDSATVHYLWVCDKWLDIFLKRESTSKGYKRDYYTMQPRDYDKPKREFLSFIVRLKALNAGIFVTCQEKSEYAEGELMRKIGMIADAHKSLPYYMDTVIHIEPEEGGKAKATEKRHTKFVAMTRKDRTNLLNQRFVWVDGEDDGYSKTFVTMMQQVMDFKAGKTENLGQNQAEAAAVKDSTEDKPKERNEMTSSSQESGRPVSNHQLRRLKWFKDVMEIDNTAWKKILEKRMVNTARNLNRLQADEIIVNLYKRLPENRVTEYRVQFEGANAEGESDKFSGATG